MYSAVSWPAVGAGWCAALSGAPTEARAALEQRLASRLGALDVLLTDSGTSALRLALGERGATRPVAVPAYSCYDIVTAVDGAELPVVFYDVDPSTLGPEEGSLREAIETEPSAVVVCHLFGHLVDVPAVEAVCGEALLVEDAAQGVGGRLRGRALGSFGSVSVLSFGRGKGMTGGSGGALLAHDERGREVVASARRTLGDAQGGARSMVALAAQLVLGRPSVYGLPASLPFLHLGETRYHPPRPPTAMADAAVAVLGRTIDLTDREIAVRGRHARRLEAALAGSCRASGMRPVDQGEPGYLRLPALLTSSDRSSPAEWERLGVARGYPRPLPELPTVQDRTLRPRPMPGAESLADRLVTLPTHSLLREQDLAALEEWLAAGANAHAPVEAADG